MKKILIAGGGLIFVMAATGAVILGQDLVMNSQRIEGDYPARSIGNGLVVYIDPITKCEYLRSFGSNTALTPRVASDGMRQAGCGAPRQQSLADFDRR